MNIWILHPSSGGPGVGRHWRPYWLAEAWNRMGHRTIVVCATFHHLMQGEPKMPGEARIGDVDYWYVKAPSYRGNGFGRLRNNFAYGRQVASDADALVRKFGRPDLIIASIPHLFHVPDLMRSDELKPVVGVEVPQKRVRHVVFPKVSAPRLFDEGQCPRPHATQLREATQKG